jgi:hypothetical protein
MHTRIAAPPPRSSKVSMYTWSRASRKMAVGFVVGALPACRHDDGGAAGTEGTSTGPTDDSTSSTASASGSADDTGTTGEEMELVPSAGGLRRLISYQYVDSIELLLGPEAAAAANPPSDQSVGAWDSTAARSEPLAPVAIDAYEGSSLLVGQAAAAHPEVLAATAPCVTQGPQDAACYEQIARELGRLAWRRPLLDEEVAGLVALADKARDWAEGDFVTGVAYEIATILQSPHFLYLVEVGEVDPDTGLRRLAPNEIATRMSFFLVGRTPDAALLDLAEAGGLQTDEELRAAAWAMLEQPAARVQLERFFGEYLEIRHLEQKGKTPELFPVWNVDLAAALEEETYRLVEQVVFDDPQTVLALIDSQQTWMNAQVASIYGVDGLGEEWEQVTVPSGQQRAGMFSHPAFLAQWSHPDLNSPVRRGLFIQEKILCNDIDSPVMVDTTLPPAGEIEGSLREWLELTHLDEPTCATCHAQMDPVGFALEHFNPVGEYRNLDNGVPVDASGSVAGVGTWNNWTDLASTLRADPRVPACLTKNLYRSALGTFETPDQRDAFEALEEASAELEHDFQSIMVELAVSPLFLLVDEPK